ncbi:GIY-YIG nuclease family protein [Aeromonas veronii]|uniref:GIY-YIG nuclease family protein n=1 Tax=Aeromonas veronii TaxID=654 RepID=UPI00244414D9|nr:GIY-YIG nuclease family protein [Aeromonas veronii]
MEYDDIESLEKYLKQVEKELLSEANRKEVKYPQDKITPWNSEGLIQENEDLLSSATGNASVYAIYTADHNSDSYSLRYIGKTRKSLARTRLKNHLIKKHEKTGAKLSKVIDHVQSGGKIKISWVSVSPESLRNYIEEELIEKHSESNWNKHAGKDA